MKYRDVGSSSVDPCYLKTLKSVGQYLTQDKFYRSLTLFYNVHNILMCTIYIQYIAKLFITYNTLIKNYVVSLTLCLTYKLCPSNLPSFPAM